MASSFLPLRNHDPIFINGSPLSIQPACVLKCIDPATIHLYYRLMSGCQRYAPFTVHLTVNMSEAHFPDNGAGLFIHKLT